MIVVYETGPCIKILAGESLQNGRHPRWPPKLGIVQVCVINFFILDFVTFNCIQCWFSINSTYVEAYLVYLTQFVCSHVLHTLLFNAICH